jgi:competence protein ComEC
MWSPFPFVRYVLALGAGILCYFYLEPDGSIFYWYFIGLTLLYGLLHQLIPRKRAYQWSHIFGLLGLGVVFIFGILLANQRTGSQMAGQAPFEQDSITHYQAVVISVVAEKAQTYRAEVEVTAIRQKGNWSNAADRVLLTFNKSGFKPAYGDRLLIKGQPKPVAAPANPGEFDQRQYLFYQHITHQQYLRPEDVVLMDQSVRSGPMAYAVRVRQFAEEVMEKVISTKREYAVAEAIVLGSKDELDQETKSAYAASGAMHVLAVSGLHVGILYLLLVYSLGWMKTRVRYGRWTFAGIVLILLWFYAFVTALSPSVLRAVTMFSFVVLAEALTRNTNVYNTLAVSAFVLLCVEPYFLMSVGFQLSYLAVVGILWFTPGLTRLLSIPDPYATYRRWTFWKKLKHPWDYERWLLSLWQKALDWLWTATCVSVAAQIATFPLALYYFHQFPNYFLLANPAVLLLSTLILPLGLMMLAVAGVATWLPVFSSISSFLGTGLESLLWLLNTTVHLTEKLPNAVLSGISINIPQMLLIYACIFSVVLLFELRRFRYVWLSFALVLILTSLNWQRVWASHRQSTLVIHSIRQHSVVSIIEGRKASLIADSAFFANPTLHRFHLNDFYIGKGVQETEPMTWTQAGKSTIYRNFGHYSLMVWKGKTFLLITQPLAHEQIFLSNRSIDYLIVQNGAVKKLDALIRNVPVKKVVLDSSTKPYLRNALSQEASKLGIACHDLTTQGAFIIE